MFLGQVDSTFVRDAEVDGKLTDKEHGQVVVLGNQSSDGTHRYKTDYGRFESSGGSHKILFGKIGAIGKVFAWFNHADNLTSTSYAIFEDFNFTTDKTH